jgi:uncharacterized protein (DUF2141 family)
MKYLSLIAAITFMSAFRQQTEGTLTINTASFNNGKGKAVVFLFRKSDGIPNSPFKTLSVNIKDNNADFQFQNLPYGEYAIILLHDENNNGKIDHSFGLPSEQLGYTNNWELGFFTGMPTFSKLKFQFSATAQTQSINITYKKNKN